MCQMLDKYQAHLVESKLQNRWNDADGYRVLDTIKIGWPQKSLIYACSMLPYQEGSYHWVHVRSFIKLMIMLTSNYDSKANNV